MEDDEDVKRIFNLIIERQPVVDLKLKLFLEIPNLPTEVDLRSKCPDVYNQGNLGSCTAQALAAAFEFNDGISNPYTPSRLFIYYNERVLGNNVNQDSGAYLSDGIKTLERYGVCDEKDWPHDISKFRIKPPTKCYTNALLYRAYTVNNIRSDLNSMKNSLASGFPFVVGIAIYPSFLTTSVNKTGIVSMPNRNKEKCLGGHAVLVVGYSDIKQHWILRNSWGNKWGDKGYFYLPYLYLLDAKLSSDLWNITKITQAPVVKAVVKPVVKAVINPKRVPVAKSSLKKLTIGHIINLKLQIERLQEELKNIKEQLDNDVEDGDEDKDGDEDGDKDVDED